MIVIETEKDSCGMWCFSVSAGEKGAMDDYCTSDYDYESSEEAEMSALRWIVDAWNVM